MNVKVKRTAKTISMREAPLTTIEKIIKVLVSNKKLAWSLKSYHKAKGEEALSERYLGKWLGYDDALSMLTDELYAEEVYKIQFAKEAPNVDVP